MLPVTRQSEVAAAADRYLLLLFWAPWHAASWTCRNAFHALAADADRRVAFAECDIDLGRELVDEWHVSVVPTLLMVASGGAEIRREVGPLSEGELAAWLHDVTVFAALDP